MITTQQLVNNVATIDAPVPVVNGDNYVLAWTATDQSISWTTCPASSSQTSYAWVPAHSVPGAASSGAPALASMNGKVWMVWKNGGNDSSIMIASLTGSNWSKGVPILGIGTSSGPALTATATGLLLVWKGESDNTLWWSKSNDGVKWAAGTVLQAPVPGAGSLDTPGLTAFQGTAYLAWKGESDTSIYWITYTDAGGWGLAKRLSGSFATSHGPAVGAGDTGNIHFAWKLATNNTIWTATLTSGNVWTQPAPIPVVGTAMRPALASQGSAATDIMVTWQGATTPGVYAGPLDALLTEQTQNYQFSIDSFQILNTRSGNIFSTSRDTDYVSLAVTVGTATPLVVTENMGNLGNGTYPTGVGFSVTIADGEKVVLSYHIINNSQGESNASTYLRSVGEKLSVAGVQALSTAAGAAAGEAIGSLLGLAIPVPLLGSALGALGGWLLSSAWGVAFPDCDGPVASAVRTFTGAELRALTAKGPSVTTDDHPGINSPSGCGSNSHYTVTWSIKA